jgi:hypothetical protein
MSEIYSCEDLAKKPSRAIRELGGHLKNSALRLFLGAGVSSGFGLPEWTMLIAGVLGRHTDDAFIESLRSMSTSQLGGLLDTMDDGSESYVRGVHGALYRNIAPNLLEQLQRSPLLLAVAAMMTGAHRGRIDSVVTYNYDDLLEQYLGMLGLKVCYRSNQTQLSTRADVEVNYVHGRLPQRWEAPMAVPVLSEKSYRLRRAEIDAGWSAFVELGLYSKIGLFMGLSGDDSAILDILKRAELRVKRPDNRNGYWLLTPDAFERNKEKIRDVGMCPIPLPKEAIAQFVFDICQEAAR